MNPITVGFLQACAVALAFIAGGWRGVAVILAAEVAVIVAGAVTLHLADTLKQRKRMAQRGSVQFIAAELAEPVELELD